MVDFCLRKETLVMHLSFCSLYASPSPSNNFLSRQLIKGTSPPIDLFYQILHSSTLNFKKLNRTQKMSTLFELLYAGGFGLAFLGLEGNLNFKMNHHFLFLLFWVTYLIGRPSSWNRCLAGRFSWTKRCYQVNFPKGQSQYNVCQMWNLQVFAQNRRRLKMKGFARHCVR